MKGSNQLEFAARSARLAEAASLGDHRAFAALLRLWHPRLLAFAVRKAGPDGEDVLQMAALTLSQDIQKLRDPSRFGPWAMTIISRRAADHFDHHRRERARRDALAANPMTPEPHPENAAVQRDALIKALGQLSADMRTLLTLHYIDGLTGPEMARLLNLPEGTVKSRLHSARARLRQAYELQEET
jgi:RNA polymerase sigma-70 factor (ECF subfamily)